MDRTCSAGQQRKLQFLLAITLLVTTTGCSAMAGLMYVINGMEVPADFDGMKKKRVAVICRPPANNHIRNAHASEMLARQTGTMLQMKVPKIDVVKYDDVHQWADIQGWGDHSELAEAVDADMVLAIDLEAFDIMQGQTLYQGRARVTLRVYDYTENAQGALVYERIMPPSLYPPNSGVPTSDRQEDVFRREYIAILSDEIGRHFYRHDAHANLAVDSMALK